jgi:DNA-directed RNA polymerase specialized sigma24 family protein
VELKYFAGMTSEQISHVLGVSVRTIDGDWAMARAWLKLRLVSQN